MLPPGISVRNGLPAKFPKQIEPKTHRLSLGPNAPEGTCRDSAPKLPPDLTLREIRQPAFFAGRERSNFSFDFLHAHFVNIGARVGKSSSYALVMVESDRRIRILLAAEIGPATLQVFIKHVAVDHPEAIPVAAEPQQLVAGKR